MFSSHPNHPYRPARRLASFVVGLVMVLGLVAGAGPAAADAEADGAQRPRVNLGITPFKPQPDGPDDPAFSRLGRIDDYFETDRYLAFKADLQAEAAERDLRIAEIEEAAGVFEGVFEPSVSVDLRGDPAAAADLADEVGGRFLRQSVLVFEADPDGPDVLYILPEVGDDSREIRRAVRAMADLSLLGGRFVDGTLEIGDFGDTSFDEVAELARRLDTRLGLRRGHLQFLEP
ncbi:MAG: hypothetical protein ACRD0A_14270 [Acidimicrobiales bacterium]